MAPKRTNKTSTTDKKDKKWKYDGNYSTIETFTEKVLADVEYETSLGTALLTSVIMVEIIYTKAKYAKHTTLICTWVDDLLIVSNDPNIHDLRTELERDQFEISHFAPINKYLGAQVEYNRAKNTLKISQKEYIVIFSMCSSLCCIQLVHLSIC